MKFSTTFSALVAIWGVAAMPQLSSPLLGDNEIQRDPKLDELSDDGKLTTSKPQKPKGPQKPSLKCFVDGFAGSDNGLSFAAIKNLGEVEGLIAVPPGGCWQASCLRDQASVYLCNRTPKLIDVQPVHAVKAALEVHHWCSSTIPGDMTVQGEYFNNTAEWSIILGRRKLGSDDRLEVCRPDLNHGF